MTHKKAKTVTIEAHQLLIIRRGRIERGWCQSCGAEVEVITRQSVEFRRQGNTDLFQHWLDEGRVHSLRAADGSTGICLNSLLGSGPAGEQLDS